MSIIIVVYVHTLYLTLILCMVFRLVRVLLEQVVSSTIERCVDPQLMEQSVCVHIEPEICMAIRLWWFFSYRL